MINPITTTHQPFADLAAQPATPFPDAPAALASLEPALLTLADPPPFRGSVPKVMPNALRLARAYARDRARFVEAFTPKGFDAAAHDDIELRALALWQADVQLRLLIDPQVSLPRLVEHAAPLRRKLLRAAIYLWEHDPELGGHVSDIRKGQGYLDLADDLTTLATLFESKWDTAGTRADVSVQELADARRLGVDIVHTVTQPGSGDAVDAARALRHRAGHYLRLGVDRVHAAAQSVFFDDPDRLAAYPRLFAGLGGRPTHRATGDSPDGDAPGTDAPDVPAPAPPPVQPDP